MSASAHALGMNEEVHPELARANLHRIRHQLKEAEDICLGILRRYPNTAAANTMLGEIAMERGEYAQAAEWFDLALDLNPDSKNDREKRDEALRKVGEGQRAAQEEQVGVPAKRVPWPAILAGGGGVLVGLIAVVAYLAQPKPQPVAPSDEHSKPIVLKDDAPKKMETPTAAAPAADPTVELADRVADAAAVDRGRLVSFAIDVKTKSIRMELKLGPDDDRTSRARLIHHALALSEAPTVILEALREGGDKAVTTASRAQYEETQTPEWQQANGASLEALVLHYLGAETPAEPLPKPPVDQVPADDAPPPSEGELPSSDQVGGGN